MVLVDSSVWIGFFRGRAEDVTRLEGLIRGTSRVVLCGPVLQEVLQGVRDDAERARIKRRFMPFPFLRADREHYLHAAETYSSLRRRGVTVPSVDVLIASHAILAGCALATHDRHFEAIARVTSLKIL